MRVKRSRRGRARMSRPGRPEQPRVRVPVPGDSIATLRADALRILRAGVAAADPGASIRRALHIQDDVLTVGNAPPLRLSPRGRIYLVAAGKAAAEMTAATAEILGERLTAGTATIPAGVAPALKGLPRAISVWQGGHPVPEIGGLAGAAEALAMARVAGSEDLVLCVLSGGASALWSAPAPGITLNDLRGATTMLLRSGAPIEEVNAVRKHLSGIAGGWLARAAGPARVLTLAIRDVIGASLDSIGSGPTLPDPTTYADALEIVERYTLALPASALRHLRAGAAGDIPETPKRDELPNDAGFEVVLSIHDAMEGAAARARALGYDVRVRSGDLEGEARDVADHVTSEIRAVQGTARARVALLWGGETTVLVRGNGNGGRNQELALTAAIALEGAEGVVVASMGTDGRDGPTDAAGGIVDGGTVARGEAAGLDASAYLEANDSHPYLAAADDLIVTGPTGTNVNDLVIALVTPGSGGG